MELAERVRQGAELLDKVRPGWEEEIGLESLKLYECDILAKLYGTLEAGLSVLKHQRSQPVDAFSHGFDIHDGENYMRLIKAWRREIEKRLTHE